MHQPMRWDAEIDPLGDDTRDVLLTHVYSQLACHGHLFTLLQVDLGPFNFSSNFIHNGTMALVNALSSGHIYVFMSSYHVCAILCKHVVYCLWSGNSNARVHHCTSDRSTEAPRWLQSTFPLALNLWKNCALVCLSKRRRRRRRPLRVHLTPRWLNDSSLSDNPKRPAQGACLLDAHSTQLTVVVVVTQQLNERIQWAEKSHMLTHVSHQNLVVLQRANFHCRRMNPIKLLSLSFMVSLWELLLFAGIPKYQTLIGHCQPVGQLLTCYLKTCVPTLCLT